MVTFFIAIFTGALAFLLLNRGKSRKEIFSKESRNRYALVVLIALLTLVALFDPKIRGKINELRQNLGL